MTAKRQPKGELSPAELEQDVESLSADVDALHRGMLALLARVERTKGRITASPTFAEFAPRFLEEHCRANRHKPRGVEAYESILRNHLLPRFGKRQMHTLASEDLQRLKADLAARSPKTVNNILSCLSSMLTQAVSWGVLDQKPCRIKLLKYDAPEPEFYEQEEYERLTVAAQTIGLKQYVLTLLGGDAGCRSSEARALEWRDVDWRRNQLHIRRADSKGHVTSPKGDRARRVPMTDELARALERLREQTPPLRRGGRVLLRDDWSNVSEQTARTWMAHVEQAAGFRRMGSRREAGRDGALHILRHTFCSHLAMLGASLSTIQKLAGHRSARTTERYIHVGPNDSARAVQMLTKARSTTKAG